MLSTHNLDTLHNLIVTTTEETLAQAPLHAYLDIEEIGVLADVTVPPAQAVIFLYLLDNNTSLVVLGSAGIGTLIEFWKVTRAVDISIDRTGSFPRLRFKDKAGYS